MLFYAGLLPSLSSTFPYSPTKKIFGSARIPRPNTAGAGLAHAKLPTRDYATDLNTANNAIYAKQYQPDTATTTTQLLLNWQNFYHDNMLIQASNRRKCIDYNNDNF